MNCWQSRLQSGTDLCRAVALRELKVQEQQDVGEVAFEVGEQGGALLCERRARDISASRTAKELASCVALAEAFAAALLRGAGSLFSSLETLSSPRLASPDLSSVACC